MNEMSRDNNRRNPITPFYVPLPERKALITNTLSIGSRSISTVTQRSSTNTKSVSYTQLTSSTPSSSPLSRNSITTLKSTVELLPSISSSPPISIVIPLATPTMVMTQPVSGSHFYNNDMPLSDTSPQSNIEKNNTTWLAPLFGALGTLILLIIILICMVRRNKRLNRTNRNIPGPRHKKYQQPSEETDLNKHSSWTSFSTVTPSTDYDPDKATKITVLDTPSNYNQDPLSVQEKRLTNDTLVDPCSFPVMMLNKQYSPQLAFSPSLAPSEFQQQISMPPQGCYSDMMYHRKEYLSLDDKLPDYATQYGQSTDNSYTYVKDRIKPRINIYVPKMNLPTDFENPFHPYPYPDEKEECDLYSTSGVNTYKS
ncbi:hypothetical protein BDB01DRAFT_148379 [Pilobolus umbonatus]|nr:hypothetical protein BDB01DRAFT_148379 [Pilobolus umbonatus]